MFDPTSCRNMSSSPESRGTPKLPCTKGIAAPGRRGRYYTTKAHLHSCLQVLRLLHSACRCSRQAEARAETWLVQAPNPFQRRRNQLGVANLGDSVAPAQFLLAIPKLLFWSLNAARASAYSVGRRHLWSPVDLQVLKCLECFRHVEVHDSMRVVFRTAAQQTGFNCPCA